MAEFSVKDAPNFFEPLRPLEPDGLFLPTIKAHSLQKIRRHNYYASIFSTAMKDRWPQRAYLGLYSGSGRARVEDSGEIIETTPLAALRFPNPFTKYIFVDNDHACVESLRQRIAALPGPRDVTLIEGDVNQSIPEIRRAMPHFNAEHGLLSFCFVDPFAANLQFRTIRALAKYRMDFLILLALGVDVRRNVRLYYADRANTRIADLIDCPTWREEFTGGENIVRFIARKFDRAMTDMGYQSAAPQGIHEVKVRNKGVMQYLLVFYSRNPLGPRLWNETLSRLDLQQNLGL